MPVSLAVPIIAAALVCVLAVAVGLVVLYVRSNKRE